MFQLKSKRAYFRRFTKTDLPKIRKLMKDRETMKWTGYRRVQTNDEIDYHLSLWCDNKDDNLGVWAAIDNLTDEFIGWAMLKLNKENELELGFMIASNKRNQGYAKEISLLLLDHAKKIGVDYVVANTDADNIASKRTLLSVGMKEVSSQKGLMHFIYSIK